MLEVNSKQSGEYVVKPEEPKEKADGKYLQKRKVLLTLKAKS